MMQQQADIIIRGVMVAIPPMDSALVFTAAIHPMFRPTDIIHNMDIDPITGIMAGPTMAATAITGDVILMVVDTAITEEVILMVVDTDITGEVILMVVDTDITAGRTGITGRIHTVPTNVIRGFKSRILQETAAPA